MSCSFTKLASTLTDSSLWQEDYPTRILFVAMLSKADRLGRVLMSVPGLAHRARITLPETESALNKFLAPDPYSTTPDNEGRRIEKIDGGWRILNYAKYREMRDEEGRKEYQKDWIKSKRRRKKSTSLPKTSTVDHVSNDVEPCRPIADSREQIAEAEKKTKSSFEPKRARTIRDDLFDALLSVDGIPAGGVGNRGSEYGQLVTTLLNTDKDATPENVSIRAANYSTHWDTGFSAHAVVKWWYKLSSVGPLAAAKQKGKYKGPNI